MREVNRDSGIQTYGSRLHDAQSRRSVIGPQTSAVISIPLSDQYADMGDTVEHTGAAPGRSVLDGGEPDASYQPAGLRFGSVP